MKLLIAISRFYVKTRFSCTIYHFSFKIEEWNTVFASVMSKTQISGKNSIRGKNIYLNICLNFLKISLVPD